MSKQSKKEKKPLEPFFNILNSSYLYIFLSSYLLFVRALTEEITIFFIHCKKFFLMSFPKQKNNQKLIWPFLRICTSLKCLYDIVINLIEKLIFLFLLKSFTTITLSWLCRRL